MLALESLEAKQNSFSADQIFSDSADRFSSFSCNTGKISATRQIHHGVFDLHRLFEAKRRIRSRKNTIEDMRTNGMKFRFKCKRNTNLDQNKAFQQPGQSNVHRVLIEPRNRLLGFVVRSTINRFWV